MVYGFLRSQWGNPDPAACVWLTGWAFDQEGVIRDVPAATNEVRVVVNVLPQLPIMHQLHKEVTIRVP